MVVRERCQLCGVQDNLDNLVAACLCYKKSDSSRLHRACLEKAISANDSDDPLRCPRCRKAYSVTVKYNFAFSWARCLSMRAISHAVEFFIVIVMVVSCGSTLYMFFSREEKRRQAHPGTPRVSDERGVWLVWLFAGLTLLLLPLTLKKVYGRWIKANADSEITSIV